MPPSWTDATDALGPSPHVMLIGEGAEAFARQEQIELVTKLSEAE